MGSVLLRCPCHSPVRMQAVSLVMRLRLTYESQEKQLFMLSSLGTGLLIGTALGVILPE